MLLIVDIILGDSKEVIKSLFSRIYGLLFEYKKI